MKIALNRHQVDPDGTVWYIQRNNTRQRAAIETCKTCGDEYATFPRGNNGFCSQACVRRPCLECGKDFHPASNRAVYCSLECKRGTRNCKHCGKAFVPDRRANDRAQYCSTSCFYEMVCPFGTVRNGGDGYKIIKVPKDTPGSKRGGSRSSYWMLEHRYVMQQVLGRPLKANENVHHKNGKRDDNRPENLELWKRKQPYGVRSADYHCPGCRCHEH